MGRYKVLYVDDLIGEHESFAQYIEIPLADKVEVEYSRSHIIPIKGYKPVIELVKEQKYDIAVVDINLSAPPVGEGDAEGIEVIETILTKHPETLIAVPTAYPEGLERYMPILSGYGITPAEIISKRQEHPGDSWHELLGVIKRFLSIIEARRAKNDARA